MGLPYTLCRKRHCVKPENITDVRSWFGLVNQVAWAYSIGPIMEPFRELIKTNSSFHWDSTLDQLFSESKELLIKKVSEGICAFDPERHTCLQHDWSKQGLGYLLLQKYCLCSLDNAPICCSKGVPDALKELKVITPN